MYCVIGIYHALPTSTGVIPSRTQPPNTVPCLSALPRTQGAMKIQGMQ